MNEEIKQAVEILRQGGIIIYPTDTAFGIGCRIDDEKAVRKLFEIRERPLNKPCPVLFHSIELVKEYVTEIPSQAEELMKKYWPGALTIILPANAKVGELVRGQTGIGCRIPNHEIPLTIVAELGVPIIGTSANFPGMPTPYHFSELDQKLISRVDLTVNGETNGQEVSTVIDCTQSKIKILRQGAVPIDDLEI